MAATTSLSTHDATALLVVIFGIPLMTCIILFSVGLLLRRAFNFHIKLVPLLYIICLILLICLSLTSWTYIGIFWALISILIATALPLGYSASFCDKFKK